MNAEFTLMEAGSKGTSHASALGARVIGVHDRGAEGPTVIVTAGMHGNEQAGVIAARKVLEQLEARPHPFHGRLVCLAGNLKALECGERFLKRDLNRIWHKEDIAELLSQPLEHDGPEQVEQRELLAAIDHELALARGRIVHVDLHSTSASSAPFCIFADTLQNRELGAFFPIPQLLGLEERISGPLISLMADRGNTAIVIEGGRHADPRTEYHLRAAIWISLVASGLLTREDAPEAQDGFEALGAACHGLPGVVEIRHCQPILVGDGFAMEEGFDNFQWVGSGEVVAHDSSGPIATPEEGYMLMPLYQGQGEDGFFLGREASRSWLQLSVWMRVSGVEELLSGLPGLERTAPDTLRAPGSSVGPFVRRILRLFGYRRERWTSAGLEYRRRPENPAD